MKLLPLQFHSQKKTNAFLRLLKDRSLTEVTQLREHLLVATNGETYFLDDIDSLDPTNHSKKNIQFPSKNGRLYSIQELQKEYRVKKNLASLSLIYNKPQAEMLVSFLNRKVRIPYDPIHKLFPILFPIITAAEVSYEKRSLKSIFRID